MCHETCAEWVVAAQESFLSVKDPSHQCLADAKRGHNLPARRGCARHTRALFFFGCVCVFLGGTSTFIFNCKQARIFFGRASFRGFRQYRKARWRGVLGISSLNNKSVDIDARNPLQSTESARKGRHACIIYAFICAASASMSACILAKCASRSPAQRTTRCRTVSSAFVFIVFHLCPMQTV